MKILLTALAIVSSLVGYCQNFQPFNETSSKRFYDSNNTTDDSYFFHADSTAISVDSIIFYQYYTIQNTGQFGNDPSGCSFWGGTTDEILDTTWLGNELIWNTTTHELSLKNEQGETINFDFNITLGANSLFYSNGSVNYYLEHTSFDLETFFGISDSVKTFVINATDNVGNPITSDLNGFEVKLSKNYGLLSFINTYDFPSIEQGQELRGQTNPLLGDYQLTYEESYPWNVNDVVQYYNYESMGFGSPHTRRYSTYTVTDRTETTDSVLLEFSVDQIAISQNQWDTTIQSSSFNAQISFKKATPVSELPWNKPFGDFLLTTAKEDSIDHCGIYESYTTSEAFTTYCDSCRCFGNVDGFGQTVEQKQYAKQYGLFKTSFVGYGPLQSVPSGGSSVIYSNISGVECGTLWNNIDEIDAFNLDLFPNPTNDLVTINSEFPIEGISIRDFSGRIVRELSNIDQKETTISIADLQNGAYIIEVTANDSAQKKTIFKH